MPEISITSATLTKLQKLAIPLVDTYDSLVSRLADAAIRGVVFAKPSNEAEFGAPKGSDRDHIRDNFADIVDNISSDRETLTNNKDSACETIQSISQSSPHAPISYTDLDSSRLEFTKLIAAQFDGIDIPNPTWSALVAFAHIRAYNALGSLDKLHDASHAHIRPGVVEDHGFSFVPEGSFSIQGMKATRVWLVVTRLAARIGTSTSVEFCWAENPKAAHPGQRSRRSYNGGGKGEV